MLHQGYVPFPQSSESVSAQHSRIRKRQNRNAEITRNAGTNVAIANGTLVEHGFNNESVEFQTTEQAALYAGVVAAVQECQIIVYQLSIEPMMQGISSDNQDQQRQHFSLILTEDYDSENLNYFDESYVEKLDFLLEDINLASTNCINMLSKLREAQRIASENSNVANFINEGLHLEILNSFEVFLINNNLINQGDNEINETVLNSIKNVIEVRQNQILQIDDEISDVAKDEIIKKSVENPVFLPFVNVFMKVFKQNFKSMKDFQKFYKKHKSTIVKKVDEDKLDDKNSFSEIASLLDDARMNKQMQTTVAAYYAGKTITGSLKYEKTNGDPRKVDDLVQTLKDRHEAEIQVARTQGFASAVVSGPSAISDIGKAVTSLTHLNDAKNKEKDAISKYYENMIIDNLIKMGYEERPQGSGKYVKDINGSTTEVNVKDEVKKRVENFKGGVNKTKNITNAISSLASSANKLVSIGTSYEDVNNKEDLAEWSFANKALGVVSSGAKLVGSAVEARDLKKDRSEIQNLASNIYKKIKVDNVKFLEFRIGQITKTSPGDLVPVLPKEQRQGLVLDDSISNKKMSRLQSVVELKKNKVYYNYLKVYVRNIKLLNQAESLEIRLNAIDNRRKRAIVNSVSKSADAFFWLGGFSKYANKSFTSLGGSPYGRYMGEKIDGGVQTVPNLWATTMQEQISRIGGSFLCLVSNIMGHVQKKREERNGIKEGEAFGKIIRPYIEAKFPKEEEIYRGYDFVRNEFVHPMDWNFMRKMRDASHLFEDTKAGLGNTLMNKLVMSAAKYNSINEEEDFEENDDDLDKLSGKDKKDNELVNMVRILHMQVSSEI